MIPTYLSVYGIFDDDNLPNANTIVIICSTTIGFQPPKMGGYALLDPPHKAIPSPPYQA